MSHPVENQKGEETTPDTQIKVAILCKYPQRLAQALQFLRKRDISAHAFRTLPEFLNGMKEDSFDIMLISLSFSHQRPEKIPSLMQQMFKLPSVVFCETKDAATQLALNSFKFKIPDHATGPAIAMAIARAFRELEADLAAPSERSNKLKQFCQSHDADRRIITMSGKSEDHGDPLYQAQADDDDNVYVNQGARQGSEIYIDEGKGLEKQAILHTRGTASGSNTQPHRKAGPQAGINHFDPSTSIGDETSSSARKGAGRRSQNHLMKTDSEDEGENSIDLDALAGDHDEMATRDLSMDSIALWVCALNAVKTVAGPGAEVLESVEKPGLCYLLSLRTSKAQGTFIIMIESIADSAPSLGAYLIDELFGQMAEHGLGQPITGEFDLLEVEPYLIQDEVMARAKFQSARQGLVHQISMTYVSHTNMLSYADFDDDSLMEVPLASIQPDAAMEFALYLKMQVSRRYMSYVNNGNKLSRNQAVRLSGYGIRNFYIQKIDHDRYLLHVARQQIQEELQKRGLRLVKHG